jgi:hypothetical protein
VVVRVSHALGEAWMSRWMAFGIVCTEMTGRLLRGMGIHNLPLRLPEYIKSILRPYKAL